MIPSLLVWPGPSEQEEQYIEAGRHFWRLFHTDIFRAFIYVLVCLGLFVGCWAIAKLLLW